MLPLFTGIFRNTLQSVHLVEAELRRKNDTDNIRLEEYQQEVIKLTALLEETSQKAEAELAAARDKEETLKKRLEEMSEIAANQPQFEEKIAALRCFRRVSIKNV